MKILYIAKHNNGHNDDEGAISWALTQLGHDVIEVDENDKYAVQVKADLALFHKCRMFRTLHKLNMPKVFWYFDLVDWPDPTIQGRCNLRKWWMREAIHITDLGFCTDGDWVSKDTTGKLVWLTQGADERAAKMYVEEETYPPLLITAMSNRCGVERYNFVKKLKQHYNGTQLNHIEWGTYRDDLGITIAGSKIVIAPDAPVTDRYWSNRVYTSLGFGAFMLHPYSEGLTKHYGNLAHIIYYHSREELYDLIDYYLDRPLARRTISINALYKTLKNHTYKHRCEQLLDTVKERLF